MDLRKIVREIGFFETSKNLVEVLNSEDVKEKAGTVMPLPGMDIVLDTEEIAKSLVECKKKKYIFMSPEIALVENMALMDDMGEVIFLIPCGMEKEVEERLKSNLPKKMQVSIWKEPYFPEGVFPSNGMIIVCGYMAGNRLMVLPETYRMIEHYGGFGGKKVFIPYTHIPESIRYSGWMEININKFDVIWRTE